MNEKLRLAIASDLHLEFADIDLINENNADVLVLAGDILIANDMYFQPENGADEPTADRFRNFIKRCSDNFPVVLVVAGNHEFYHGNWVESLEILRREYGKYSNVHFLENDCFKLHNVTFVGATLWTDMNRSDPLTLHAVRDLLNDFSCIENDEFGRTKLRPMHTVDRHHKSLQYINTVVAEKHNETFVVIGHHAPCTHSIHDRYKHDKLMNGAFASDLSEFILDRPQIKLWVHGHVHQSNDYVVGDTRIACNPRGYPNELRTPFSLLHIDI